jgi:amino acid adenylation domain-containing protein/FkbM family methyltransferase
MQQQTTTRGFRLSPQQKRLWSLQQHTVGLPERAQCSVLIEGRLDTALLRAALQQVVEKHEVLSTTFPRPQGMNAPLQVIAEGRAVWDEFDLSGFEPSRQEAEIGLLFDANDSASAGELPLRLALIKLAPERHVLLISLPALSADNASLNNLVRDLSQCYASRADEYESVQYVVVSEWLNDLLESGDATEGVKFWRGQDYTPLISMRLPFEREAAAQSDVRSFRLRLNPELATALAQKYDSSLETLFLACWQILLHRWTGQPDVIVGTVFDGRTDEELEGALGLFARHLPIRAHIDEGAHLGAILRQLEEARGESFEWQECFVWDEAIGDGQFFPYCFEFMPKPEPIIANDVTFSLYERRAVVDRFNLKLDCELQAVTLRYESALYDAEAIERLAHQYKTLLASVVATPEVPISELEILSDEERELLLHTLNDTAEDFPQEKLLHKLFEEQAARTPHGVALEWEDGQLTYAELDQRTNQLARRLQREGVGPEVAVGVLLERSVEMVVAVLGVLKAGGFYVPLNPSLPRERLLIMLADAHVKILLTVEPLQDLVAEVKTICLDSEIADEEPKAIVVTPENLAYVIYTSGSTGRPKGVMIAHGAICNRLLWMQSAYPLAVGDSVLQKTVFNFDASIWELFVPLMSGAKIVLAKPEGHQDATYMAEEIVRRGVTTLQLVPSMLRVMLDEPKFAQCKSLKRVFCGGEALPLDLQERFYDTVDADLHNLYGPTEVAIDASSWDCERGNDYGTTRGNVPIGRPLANVQIYLLDQHLRPVPYGATGEVYVGGRGLGRGYLGRPELTAEKFLPDPFSSEPGARLYRTGDLGRLLPQGAIEFLGRIDHQVKLRGFRIELGEIESALRQHPEVEEALALVREEGGNQQLVAYVLPAVRRNASVDNLYRLPNGMEIAHLNKNETDLLYKEIFEQEGYLRHGVTIADGDCVFDVGANIGLFTLFVHQHCRGARVFSFEPSPPTFAVLKANVEMHAPNTRPYQCAVSDKPGTAEFTFYPKVSASSGLYANVEEDAGVTRAFIENQGELGRYAEELLEGRFEAVRYECWLRTLSEVIAEEGVERIDLLKVDVEKSELDVLRGLSVKDWTKVQQVVLEVHDTGGRLEAVTSLLNQHGFEVAVDQHLMFGHTGLYNVYAVHPSRHDKQKVQTGAPAARVLSSQDLRQFLQEKLPDYMIPSAFVLLDELPLTPSGKVDRNALPAPGREDHEADAAEPRTPVEELVAGVWARVLGLDHVGVNKNFFDLGGHSLLATQVVTRLREASNTDLPLRSIFEAPTVAGMAKTLETVLAPVTMPPIEPVGRDQHLPLSYAQQRVWFMDQLETDNFFFNVPAAFRLVGKLNSELLERTLNEVVRRHESLRTTFAEVDGEVTQRITPSLRIELPSEDLSELPEAERDTRVRRLADEEARRPFNLAHGPLLRAKLLRLGDEDHVALVTMHHIVSDGWSMGVLVREVSALYEAFAAGMPSPLPELRIQYADYASWQRRWMQGDVLEDQLAYWKIQLAGKPETLQLPTDRPRPPVQTYKGARQSLELPPSLAESLKDLCRQENATLFMLLLAAFNVLLHRYTAQTDIVVGTDVANRNRVEIENLVGFFVNQLVIRTDLSGDPDFRALLARVRTAALGAYAHQDVPFEKLVEELRPERDVSRTPLFQVKLVLQNAPFKSLELPGLSLSPIEFDGGKANLDLTLFLSESERGLVGQMEYNTDLFDPQTVARMLSDFELLLARVVAAPDARLSEFVETLTVAERERAESERKRVAEDSFKKFKGVKAKAVSVPREELVKSSSLTNGESLPLVLKPNAENLDLAAWAERNRDLLQSQLVRHGAILFRDFELDPARDFGRLAHAVCSDLFHENGEHPRRALGDGVYTPVFYPPEQLLLWHNENSFNHHWPARIWFGCAQPATRGGETPLADSRRVYELIDKDLRRRFSERGVMYVRNYGDGLGLDWQTVFQTEDRREVERRCREARMEIEWKDGGRARTRCVRPAAVRHPQTGESSWFNQAQHWHVSCLDPATRESIEAVYREEDYPRHCYFGDGTPIDDSMMAEVLEAYRQTEVVFAWQPRDILMVDNVLTAHARRPFEGRRELLVAMGDMRSFDEVETA